MVDTANYQSSLDGKRLNLSLGLMSVLSGAEENGGELNFVQIYCDSPHTHLSKPFKHPISGVISCCDMLHQKVVAAMHGRIKH